MDEFYKIINLIKYRKNILIKGEEGIGKTTLLKRVYLYYRDCIFIDSGPPSYILKSIANFFNIKIPKTNTELLHGCTSEIQKWGLILLIDDINLRKPGINVLKKLKKSGLIIIAAGNKEFDIFDEVIKLKPLSKGKSIEIAERILKQKFQKVPEGLLRDIAEISNGMPGTIVKICRDIVRGYELGEVSLNRESIVSFLHRFKKRKSFSFPFYILISIAYMCLVARYIFYVKHQFNTGYIFAIVGYVILSFYRILRYKKK